MVIAGSGTPGSEVHVFSNGDLLGSAKVEGSGDWVLVPDAPIAPGGTELTLGEAGKTGQAEQSFVVVINPDKRTEPLVVASTPGAASEVLQGLAPAAEALAAISSATATPAATPTPASEPTPAAVAAATPAPAPTPTVSAPPAETPTPVAATPAPTAPAVPEPAAPIAVASAPAVTPATPTPAASAPTAPAAVPLHATIDAIEIEGDRTFFAGGGSNGASVRLYVDGTFIADSIVKDGRWLVEAGKVLTKSVQRIRADLLQAGSATVAARAEVDFEVNLPAVAQAPEPTAPNSTSTAVPSATAPTVATAPAASPAAPAPATAAVPVPATPSEVPTMVANAVGDPEALRFASGKAIIRTGDNLWTIARRVYGTGIKYTTIYEANNSQIRDPDRIYPGQVFDLPHE